MIRSRPEFGGTARHLTGASLVLSLLAMALFLLPVAGGAFEYDRAAIAAGQLWRVGTCHWTHWSAEHLVWDLVAFALLGAACEELNRPRFLAAVSLSALLIPMGTWRLMPELTSYRGLSGIDSALFTLLSVTLLRDDRGFLIRGVSAVALLALPAKIAYELVTAKTLFVHVGGLEVHGVPLAHLIGAVVGVGVGAWRIPSSVIAPGGTRRQPRDDRESIA